jgi:HSP20 family protein
MSKDELSAQTNRAQTEIDRLYQELVTPTRWVVMRHAHTWRPPTDVYETSDAVIVRVEVAGMKKTDFAIELQGRLLVISGQRDDPSPKVAYHQMEVHYGEFRVEVYLHWAVDAEAVEAAYEDGFLQVKLPKVQARKVHPIERKRAFE